MHESPRRSRAIGRVGPIAFGRRFGHPLRTGLPVLGVMLLLASCSGEANRPDVSLPPTTSPTTTESGDGPVTVPNDPDIPIDVPVGADLEALVEAAQPGATFVLAHGVHRGHRIEPKDGMTFVGEQGTVLSGALVLEGFASDEDRWRYEGIEPTVRDHGECIAGYEGCASSQDLFMDDVMLWQVTDLTALEPGTWFWDGSTIWVADDPNGRRVELSTESYAFVGSADDITIRSISVQKYATPAQEGAVQSQEPGEGARGRGWLIEDVEVTGVHGAGVRGGDDTTIRDCHIHNNGQLGVTGAGGTGLVIEGSEIASNNIAGFRWEWEAGGVKVTNSFDVTFRDNHVHDNYGPGLWADLDTVDTRYEANLVVGNGGPGIFHEISGAATIRDNEVVGNGFDKTNWLWGAGILVAASSDTEVVGNVVRENANGIAGVQQERGDGPFGARLLANLHVHGNTIEVGSGAVGIVEDTGEDAVFTERDNRFESNTYVGVRGRVYRWEGRALSREAWIARGQDVDGVWIEESDAS